MYGNAQAIPHVGQSYDSHASLKCTMSKMALGVYLDGLFEGVFRAYDRVPGLLVLTKLDRQGLIPTGQSGRGTWMVSEGKTCVHQSMP